MGFAAMGRYIIGIDLGTTNSAIGYVDLSTARPKAGQVAIETFAIPQLIGPAKIGARPLLPSFLYLPTPHDLPPGSTALPWNPDAKEIVGEFARHHGARIPGRLISSAKSWLCHAGVDRTQPLLPWNAPPDVVRLSPLEVSTRYLRHMVDAWNHTPTRPADERMEEQTIVLTVPASFDDVARSLTLEAAQLAGLKHVTLLEEPQAAFYCWLGMNPPQEVGRLRPGMRCLVVDVGGGTSDFSVIRCAEEQGEITFVRESIGDHLLLGGDNMDLALAKALEGRFGSAKLDAAQFGALVQACRAAKEALLSKTPPAEVPITIMGRGRSIIGGTLSTTLKPDELRQILFEGFFPQVDFASEPRRGRGALHEMGLPYVDDPAITRHLAAFLHHQRDPADRKPDAILFNGGVFQPQVLRERLIATMRPWYTAQGESWEPLILASPSLDLAVAWGAAYCGWLKHIGGRRIGGGIPRSYYVVVERPPEATTETTTSPVQSPPRQTVLCVIPRHQPEGTEIALAQPQLELALGQPVLFPLYTSTVRGEDQAGDILEVSPDQLMELPPLHTVLRGGKRSGTKRVPVTLASRCTEIGTLELFCVAAEGEQRWRLEFNVRDVLRDPSSRSKPLPEDAEQAPLVDVWPEAQVQAAASLIRGTFTATGDNVVSPTELPKALDAALEAPRNDWPTGLCRRLWDFLAEVAEERGRSAAHLVRWYHLAGFCLRPGFGDPLDRYRIEALWKLVNAPFRAVATPGVKALESGADAWIMWRRVAGGLNTPLQQTLFNRLRPVLLGGKNKPAVKPNNNELAEMWRAAASLERLDLKTKEALGAEVLKYTRKEPMPTFVLWSLTRLGARRLLYGPMNAVVHPEVVQGWLETILDFEPRNEHDESAFGFCLAQLARRTGLRALDIEDSFRKSVSTVLHGLKVPDEWKQMVEEVRDEAQEDRNRLFGENLPIGLRLVRS